MPTAIAPELLKILCCPESHQPLAEADTATVERVNDSIRAGAVQNRAGQKVGEPLDGALIRQDRQCLYPVRQGIPVLLADEAIALREGESP